MKRSLIFVLALASGCFSAQDTTCSDGTVCPGNKVCAPSGGACVDPEQLIACESSADGDRCELASIGQGVCRNGLCVLEGCGDGVVAPGELCDDGNTTSGDGCRADCQKIEMCGDAVVDPQEACDDGNTNPADGCDACKLTAWNATVIVGAGIEPTQMQVAGPHKVALDPQGNLYVADTGNNRVLRLDAASHAVTVVAGTGVAGSTGDGGPAVAATLETPLGIAVDGVGNIYVTDRFRIRLIDAATGIISTFAGTGEQGFGGEGDGGPATLAKLRAVDVAVDGLGNVYVSEGVLGRVRKIGIDGVITTFAGEAAPLLNPSGLAVDADNNVYITEEAEIIKVTPSGVISTIAGTGVVGFSGDGGPAVAAQVYSPTGITVDAAGNVLVADSVNNRIRRIDAVTHVITTIAGPTELSDPASVAIDAAGNMYIADRAHAVVRGIDAATSTLHTALGTGTAGSGVDGEPVSTIKIGNPFGVAFDAQGRIYVSAFSDRVLRYDGNSVTVYAGGGTQTGDGVLATNARLLAVSGLAVDTAGNLYLSDEGAQRIRKVDATTGIITTVAGNGDSDYTGDDGPALSAGLGGARGIAVDSAGNLYMAVIGYNAIRRVAGGTITTIAGDPTQPGGYAGDGGPATDALFQTPSSVSVDTAGNVFIADTDNHRIREIVNGTIDTVAGTGIPGYAGDGGAATSAQLFSPNGVFVAPSGTLYIADTFNGRARAVDGSGTITTVAGTGDTVFGGDHGPAASAALGNPMSIAVNAVGDIAVVDQALALLGSASDGHVRKIDHVTGMIATVAGRVLPPGIGPRSIARLLDPGQIVVTNAFTLVGGGRTGIVQAVRPTVVDMVIGRYLQDTPTGDLARYRDRSYGNVGGIAVVGNTVYVAAGNHIDAVTVVDPTDADTWSIAHFVGDTNDAAGFRDGAQALFRDVGGLWAESGTLYVADSGNHVVRAINLTTKVTSTVAGTPEKFGYFGENVDPQAALLYRPRAIAMCGSQLFIADTNNHRVRRVAGGKIRTVLGTGVPSSSGDGAPAINFPVDAPAGLACDSSGNVYVTSSTTVRLLASDSAGLVGGSGPVSTIYGAPPRTTFPTSVTRCLSGIAVVDPTTVRFTDACTALLIDLVRQ